MIRRSVATCTVADEVLPAYAGMIPICLRQRLIVSRVLPAYAGMIPGTHGAALSRAVLPAYAGMIPDTRTRHRECVGAPRVCGDDPVILPLFFAAQRAPRVCGDDPSASLMVREISVLPAYAGMIRAGDREEGQLVLPAYGGMIPRCWRYSS